MSDVNCWRYTANIFVSAWSFTAGIWVEVKGWKPSLRAVLSLGIPLCPISPEAPCSGESMAWLWDPDVELMERRGFWDAQILLDTYLVVITVQLCYSWVSSILVLFCRTSSTLPFLIPALHTISFRKVYWGTNLFLVTSVTMLYTLMPIQKFNGTRFENGITHVPIYYIVKSEECLIVPATEQWNSAMLKAHWCNNI